jgi:hypothetical protein
VKHIGSVGHLATLFVSTIPRQLVQSSAMPLIGLQCELQRGSADGSAEVIRLTPVRGAPGDRKHPGEVVEGVSRSALPLERTDIVMVAHEQSLGMSRQEHDPHSDVVLLAQPHEPPQVIQSLGVLIALVGVVPR